MKQKSYNQLWEQYVSILKRKFGNNWNTGEGKPESWYRLREIYTRYRKNISDYYVANRLWSDIKTPVPREIYMKVR